MVVDVPCQVTLLFWGWGRGGHLAVVCVIVVHEYAAHLVVSDCCFMLLPKVMMSMMLCMCIDSVLCKE